jgi:hypothetical protein
VPAQKKLAFIFLKFRHGIYNQLLIKNNLPVPPAIAALLLQCIAVVCVLFIVWLAPVKPPLIVFAGSCGLIAAGLSYWAKMARWWLAIQVLFVPALVAALALKIQPSIFLIAFLVMLLVFWNTLNAQVPLYLSSKKVWRALESLLPPPNRDGQFRFADVGSGLGGVLVHLATVRPDGVYTGIESAPLTFLWSWLRIRLGRYRQCRVYCTDLWQCDLSAYDVVFAYLSPAPMGRLWQKVRAEMRPGTIFISSTFAVPGQTPFKTLKINDMHRSTLLIWKM